MLLKRAELTTQIISQLNKINKKILAISKDFFELVDKAYVENLCNKIFDIKSLPLEGGGPRENLK